MYRRFHQLIALSLVVLFLFAASAFAQDGAQTIPIIPLPTHRIEPPSPNDTEQELESRGDQLRGEKAYLDAIDYFDAALKKVNPKVHRAAVLHNKIGIVQLQLTRYYDARKSFEKAIKIDKKYSQAYNNLGVVYYSDRNFGKAVKYYKKALVMEPENASYHSNLGSAYFAKKKVKEAMIEYHKALLLDPDILDERSAVGVVAQMSSPEDRAHFCFLVAKMYAQMGEFDHALLYLRRAMEEGYKGIDEVYQDQQFAKLRQDQRFIALMKQPPPAIP